MKSINILLITTLAFAFSFSTQAAEVLCKGAYIDTIAVESNRSEGTQIQNSLLISFKDAQGNHHNCGGAVVRYVYLKAGPNEAIFNGMMSLAFMARANNYKVNYMVNTGATIYSAEQLAYIQIVENTALTVLN